MSWRRGADFCTIGAVHNGVGRSDPLACTSFPRVSGVGPGMAGGQGRWRSSCSWGRRTVADDVVPQGFPPDLPWPVRGQVQRRLAGGRGEAGGHVDQVAAQGGTAGDGVLTAGERPGGAQQVVRDHRAGQPRAVRGEQPRRDMREWPVDQVGEGGLHDRVFAVGKVGLGGGQGGVGEEVVLVKNG